MALVRSIAVVACLALAELGCSGSFWLGHYRGGGTGSGGGGPPGPAPTTAEDGGVPPDEPPPQGGGGVVVGGGGPLYECSEDADCVPVDCTCADGESFEASICDNGVCAIPDDCPYLCGDVPDDAGAD